MRQAPELPLTFPAAATAVLGGQGRAGPMVPLWVDSTVVLIQCWGLCKLAFLRHRGNEAVAAPGLLHLG